MPRGGTSIIGTGTVGSAAPVELLDTGDPMSAPLRAAPPRRRTGVVAAGIVLAAITVGWGRGDSSSPIVPKQAETAARPFLAGAEGLTLVAIRGDEQVFVDLTTGERRIADRPDGLPVHDLPLDVDEVVSLVTAAGLDPEMLVGTPFGVSADRRWLGYWRFGQLAVVDLESGAEQLIPDVRRTYFDERIELLG